jgi:hypothetical protein
MRKLVALLSVLASPVIIARQAGWPVSDAKVGRSLRVVKMA